MFEKPGATKVESPKLDFEEIKRHALERVFSFETEEFYMDEGGVGKVYRLPGGFCLKVMEARHRSPNRDRFDLGNTPFQEATIQEQLSHMEFDGQTRVPKMLGVIQPDRADIDGAIIMERLDAVNLQRVIKGEAELPEGFAIEDFFDDLERFTIQMHDQQGIVHDDLFARNVMIDTSGAPRLIDFGRSRRLDAVGTSAEIDRLTNRDLERINDSYETLKALQDTK